MQQKLYTHEQNWHNEAKEILAKYQVTLTEEDIAQMSKDRWKTLIKEKVYKYTLDKLNNERLTKKRASILGKYEQLKIAKYFSELSANNARIWFQIRSSTLDIKEFRPYQYTDQECRLCNNGIESIAHIVNECVAISRDTEILNHLVATGEERRSVIDCVEEFMRKIEELNDSTTSNT